MARASSLASAKTNGWGGVSALDYTRATPETITARIAYLEESFLYIAELSSRLHEHEGMFWSILENIQAEVERLKALLAEKTEAAARRMS